TVQASSNFSGSVTLKADTTALALIDTAGSITFSFNPASVDLNGGMPATSTLTVDVPTLSPDFDLSMFHVQALKSDSSVAADVAVALQVKAIYDVIISGRQNPNQQAPEKWSVAIGSVTKFISHQGGLLFRVTNMDTLATHEVHSSGGPIPHEDNNGIAPS